jgi:Protein of unknown function (DUF2523)
MGGLFTQLFAKIAAVIAWFGNIVVSIFVSLWDIFRDVFAWLFEQMLTVATTAIGALDLSGVTSNITSYGSIPANVMLVMSCIGLGQALAIIAAALVIRFTLQLIPFVRLGS